MPDTGIVNVFLKVGMDVRFDTKRSLQELCDEGVRRGYLNPDNPLRASVLDDPLFARKNTRDNTPCILHVDRSPVTRSTCVKGGGSENKTKFVMLNPSDSLVDWCSRPCRPWARAGARPACWASASAAPLKKPC